MIYIKKVFLDGTALDDLCTVAEFSPLHPTPAISWAVGSDKQGGRQAWYELTLTDAGTGRTLYDSGRVETDVQSASFDASAFPAGAYINVNLIVASTDGDRADAEERLFNGALDAFPGEWITSQADEGDRVLHFFTDFTVGGAVADAVLYTCGLGYHKAYLNWEETNDALLDPAHSNYSKVCYYRVDAESAGLLTEGKNRLEIKVASGWRHTGLATFSFSHLGGRQVGFFGDCTLWALLRITYEDGTVQDVVTGQDWLCATGAQTVGLFDGETFDARLNIPVDELEPQPAKVCAAPGGVMRPMTLQPIHRQETYAPVEITQPKPGMFVADFGQNIAGVVSLRLYDELKAGQKVTLRHSEELDEDGTIFTDTLREAKQLDTYVAAGDDRDLNEWTPEFTYHGFRYLEVTGLDALEPEDVMAVALHTDIRKRSSFTCGSAVINAIQHNLIMTEKDNIHSILTDCPQRDERMGWMNDATVRFEETPYNFDVSHLFPKVMLDIHNEQRPDGACACTAPFVFGNVPADPVCSSYLVAARSALMHCGELNAVDELFDGMAAWEDCLLSHSPDGTVDYSYYGDWAGPGYACLGGVEGAVNLETPGELMSTGYSYFNCVTLCDFAKRTGRTEAAAKYAEKAETVKAAFLKKWFDPATAKVAKGSMGSQAFALWLGILPEEYREAAARVMRDDLVHRDYQFTTGNLCTRYLTDTLAKYGYIDEAYTLLTKETYPSYGYMIQNEATTVWERFELKKSYGMNSHNHPMYGAIGSFFYQYLGGITPTEPGYTRVKIQPYFPEKLLSAHAVVDTVMGEVSVRWAKRYGKLYLFVQTPFGMTADVVFDGKEQTVGAGYHVFEKTL